MGALLMALLVMALNAGCGDARPSSQRHLLNLDGRRFDPLETTQSKATVYLFTRSDCPISNRYAPEIRHLHERFAPKGVAFYPVYPDRDEQASAITKHMKEYGYQCGALRDPDHVLVKMVAAEITPEAAVFISGASGQKLVYAGRIDDRYVDFGKWRPEATKHNLQDVLEAILEGQEITFSRTKAVGCFIRDLR